MLKLSSRRRWGPFLFPSSPFWFSFSRSSFFLISYADRGGAIADRNVEREHVCVCVWVGGGGGVTSPLSDAPAFIYDYDYKLPGPYSINFLSMKSKK